MLVAALACAALIGGAAIGAPSLWYDETMSEAFAALPWPTFWVAIHHSDAVHALYYATLHLWASVFGNGETGLRSLSAISAVATTAVGYALGSRLFGRRTGTLAAVLLAFSPFLMYFAREARSYSIVILLSGVATLAFLRARDRDTVGAWTVYAMLMVLAVYMHVYGILLFVGHAFALPSPRREPRLWLRFGASAAIVAVCAIPLLTAILGDDSSQTWWLTAPDRWELLGVFVGFAGSPWLLAAEGALLVGTLAIAVRRRAHVALWPYRFALAWLLLPIVLTFFAAHAKPMFQARYLSVAFLPFVLLVADGVARIRIAAPRFAVLGVIAALSAQAIAGFYLQPREDWRGVADFIAARAQPNDGGVVYRAIDQTPLVYYLARLPSGVRPDLLYPSPKYTFWLNYRDREDAGVQPPRPDPAAPLEERGDPVRRVAGRGDVRRLWIVASAPGRNPDTTRTWPMRAVQSGLVAQRFALRQKTRIRGIMVILYERRRWISNESPQTPRNLSRT